MRRDHMMLRELDGTPVPAPSAGPLPDLSVTGVEWVVMGFVEGLTISISADVPRAGSDRQLAPRPRRPRQALVRAVFELAAARLDHAEHDARPDDLRLSQPVAAERQRVSRELHPPFAQSLSGMLICYVPLVREQAVAEVASRAVNTTTPRASLRRGARRRRPAARRTLRSAVQSRWSTAVQ
jgi:signal transduction histidine kinase